MTQLKDSSDVEGEVAYEENAENHPLQERYWQNLRDIADAELAADLQVGERTLHEYDKCAKHITLEKVDNFLEVNHMELDELMTL